MMNEAVLTESSGFSVYILRIGRSMTLKLLLASQQQRILTDRLAEPKTDRQTNGAKDRWTNQRSDRQTDRQTKGATDRPTNGATDRQTPQRFDSQTDRPLTASLLLRDINTTRAPF